MFLLVADIHFHYKRAIEGCRIWPLVYRINPGNIGNEKKFKKLSKQLKIMVVQLELELMQEV